MSTIFHSVRLDSEKCMGCTNCIKRCPTQAIRVREGKAHIISDRCIDCGECIRICPHHAKYAQKDSLNMILDYKYRIALPAPALYGQFNNLDDPDYVLNAFMALGFDTAFEVSKGAELISEATRLMLKSGVLKKPVISSACPAVCRLIRVRFPKLTGHVMPLNAPMEEAARLAREKAVEETGFLPEEIGVFFITPCPAKKTAIKQPICNEKSHINGSFAINDIYPVLLKEMERLQPDDLINIKDSGIIGISWAGSGGESSATLNEKHLAADGIENCINVLEEVEDEKLGNIDFIELNACHGGCVGGPLTVANPFVAKARILNMRKYMPVSCNSLDMDYVPKYMQWTKPLEGSSIFKLADNVFDAMVMMSKLDEILEKLPGLDCGTCGSPSCKALAEDIVRGYATEQDCLFALSREFEKEDGSSEKYKNMIPRPFRQHTDKQSDDEDDKT